MTISLHGIKDRPNELLDAPEAPDPFSNPQVRKEYEDWSAEQETMRENRRAAQWQAN